MISVPIMGKSVMTIPIEVNSKMIIIGGCRNAIGIVAERMVPQWISILWWIRQIHKLSWPHS